MRAHLLSFPSYNTRACSSSRVIFFLASLLLLLLLQLVVSASLFHCTCMRSGTSQSRGVIELCCTAFRHDPKQIKPVAIIPLCGAYI